MLNPEDVLVQGDVLLKPINKKIKGQKVGENNYIVAYGEKTGHRHVLKGDIQVFKEKTNPRLIVVVGKQGGSLQHELLDGSWTKEHYPIEIEQGIYEIKKQREYTLLDEIRSVRD